MAGFEVITEGQTLGIPLHQQTSVLRANLQTDFITGQRRRGLIWPKPSAEQRRRRVTCGEAYYYETIPTDPHEGVPSPAHEHQCLPLLNQKKRGAPEGHDAPHMLGS